MTEKPQIPDFPTLPDFSQMITQACEVIASVRGIPYDFNGTLSLENKFVVLFKTVKETFDAQDELVKSYKALYDFVNQYFNNLDIQKEINNKIDALLKDNSFWLKLNNILPFVTPEMFGAVGDSATDDTIAIQNAIDNNKNLPIVLSKEYKVSTVTCKKPIQLVGGTLVSDTVPLIIDTHLTDCKLRGITFKGTTFSLHIKDANHLTIEGCTFINGENGVKVERPAVEVIMRGCYIKSEKGNNGIGLNVDASDGEFTNITIVNYKMGIRALGYNVFNTIHAWIWDNTICKDSIFFEAVWKSSSTVSNSFSDSYDIGYRLLDVDNFVIDNPNFYWNETIFPHDITPTLFSFYNINDAQKNVWIKSIKSNFGDKKFYFSSLGTTLTNLNYDSLIMNDSFSLLNNVSTSWLNPPITVNKITPLKDVYNFITKIVGNVVFITIFYYAAENEINNKTVVATVSVPPKTVYKGKFMGTNETISMEIKTNGNVETTPKATGEYVLTGFYLI